MIASHYAEPLLRRLRLDAVLADGPGEDSTPIAKLSEGQDMRVLDIRSGWAWGYGPDGQVGYVPEAAVAP